jgi:catechol 2,3-dioxygenase-like lactoylglutathione lyase family enzyme
MLDHVSITVSDIAAVERFYDAIMKVLDVVEVGRRPDWLGYGERSRPAHPEHVYIGVTTQTSKSYAKEFGSLV